MVITHAFIEKFFHEKLSHNVSNDYNLLLILFHPTYAMRPRCDLDDALIQLL